jgi:outer membrane receptor protein involved in Fe transport
VALYAKNLLDRKTILQSPQINSVIEAYTLRPRTVGLTAQIKF